jgi:hypothetical protein
VDSTPQDSTMSEWSYTQPHNYIPLKGQLTTLYAEEEVVPGPLHSFEGDSINDANVSTQAGQLPAGYLSIWSHECPPLVSNHLCGDSPALSPALQDQLEGAVGRINPLYVPSRSVSIAGMLPEDSA